MQYDDNGLSTSYITVSKVGTWFVIEFWNHIFSTQISLSFVVFIYVVLIKRIVLDTCVMCTWAYPFSSSLHSIALSCHLQGFPSYLRTFPSDRSLCRKYWSAWKKYKWHFEIERWCEINIRTWKMPYVQTFIFIM